MQATPSSCPSPTARGSSGRDRNSPDDSITVTINVENVDEPGAVALSSLVPQLAVALTATLTDPDGGLARVVWLWERSADQTFWTRIDGARTESYTPVIGDLSSYLRVTASYADGHGPDKSRKAVVERRVADNLERSVAENTGEGSAVGAPVATTSPGVDPLTYVLGGADAALFSIDADTGQIRVGAGTALDYEADKNVYGVTVTATDSSGVSATVAVTITVTNVDLPGIANDYDVDDNELIDRVEAISAVADYFSGVITQEEAVEVVRHYFAG